MNDRYTDDSKNRGESNISFCEDESVNFSFIPIYLF